MNDAEGRQPSGRKDPGQVGASPADDDADRPDPESVPAIQRFYENIWLWAFLAILFWAVSYLGWGYLDLMLIEAG